MQGCRRTTGSTPSWGRSSRLQFEKCLLSWVTALHDVTEGQVIAIDGKTLQRVTDAKSNEITALPKLLEMLEIKGCLVTIDAMGCQREIAQQIVKGGADYVLAVKENQPKRHEAIQEFFGEHLEDDCESIRHRRFESHEKGHGRKDDRYYYLAKLPEDFSLQEKWPGLKAIGMAVRVTEHKDGRESHDVRYYIASRYLSGQKFAKAVRGHWGIENSLHWQLDVTLGARPVPCSQRPRRRQPQPAEENVAQPAEEQHDGKGRRQEQTTVRRVERRISAGSGLRKVTYGAIALAG